MPHFPCGLKLAISVHHIPDAGFERFGCPRGHFWYETPDVAINPPPFESGAEIICDLKHAPVPVSRLEVSGYVRVIHLDEAEKEYWWEGDILASFQIPSQFQSVDVEAWNSWIQSEAVMKFLDEAIERCRRQSEFNATHVVATPEDSDVVQESGGTTAPREIGFADNPLKMLLGMEVEERVDVIAQDLHSRADKYRHVSPFDLANALEVPQPEQPNGDWSFTRYANKISLEEYLQENAPGEDLFESIKHDVSAERLQELLVKASELVDYERPDLDFLTERERDLLESAVTQEQLECNELNGLNCIAHYCVGHYLVNLHFEAVIEDDGYCIELRSPYDKRDGKFMNLSGYVTDSW